MLLLQYPLAKKGLPAHKECPTATPVEPETSEEIPDQEDTVGQANVRRAAAPPQPQPTKPISRTTEWRQRKNIQEVMTREEHIVEKAPCKEYMCRMHQ